MARDYFNELLAKYNNIFYPSSSQRQFDTLRNDLRREILTPQFEQARMEYQNMLAGTGSSRRSVDATEGGEQQQIIINPTTGATEIVTPEYNRQFRTDDLDFNPGGRGIFENIYDVDEGRIDSRTGRPKDEEIVEDTDTGLIGNTGTGRDAMGRDKDQGASVQHTHEVINGIAYRIDLETGEVEKLDGIDATIAKILSGYVNNFTLGGILNSRETYNDKLDRIRNISEEAYNDITLNVREQYRDPNNDEDDRSLLDKFKDLFGGDTDKDPDGGTENNTGIGDIDSDADNAREQARDPFGGGTTNTGSTDAGVNSGAGGTGGSGATGGSGGFQGGANPMGGGFTGGR